MLVDLAKRFVVVVGGGGVAERKAKGALECGAEVRVVAPEATDGLAALAAKKKIEWLRREFHPADVEKAFVVFAATDNAAVNTRVCQACDVAGVLVNRAEAPEASDFIVPAVLRRGRFCVAISTGGASPHLGQIIRDRLEKEFGPEYIDYIALLEKARLEAMRTIPDPKARRQALRTLAEDDSLVRILRHGGPEAALQHARHSIATAAHAKSGTTEYTEHTEEEHSRS